ncbi:MAG: hypothetical protein R8K47_02195 [Mariprofundaceae bacterium]
MEGVIELDLIEPEREALMRSLEAVKRLVAQVDALGIIRTES